MDNRSTPARSRAGTIFSGMILLAFFLFAAHPCEASDSVMIVPESGWENETLGFGADLRLFAVPNFGFEIEGFWDPNNCGNCTLSETTLTGSLFYWINPFSRLSLYTLLGGGIGSFSLSSPISGHADLPVFDTGLGAVIWISHHFGLDIDNRWIFVKGGGLVGNPASALNAYRLSLGLAYAF
ncbi:MAG: hypothetical protein M0041_06135 [Nitrospiraceae bacterium]|nr:hypothetical protein [Nitrospiraceae bacterium]